MAEINDLNISDGSNTARFPEGMALDGVNDSARALEGLVARGWKDSVEGSLNSTGSANAYLVAANRTLSAYYDGMRQGFHANFANTGAATLDIDSVGAKTIKKNHDVDLASGDIEANQYVEVIYSATDDTFQMLSPTAASAASDTAAGIVELATTAETETGTDATRAVTPDGLHDMTTLSGAAWLLDEDDMSSDSAVLVASQQSIKAYVDTQVAAVVGDWEFVSTTAITAVTNLDVTGIASGYDYMIELEGFKPDTDSVNLTALLSTGASFKTGASDYAWSLLDNATPTQDTADTDINMSSGSFGNDAGHSGTMSVELINPGGTSERSTMRFRGGYRDGSTTPRIVHGYGEFAFGTGAVDQIRFLFSSGTFSAQGDITVWRRQRS